ncbi:MAG: hypothetical protein U0354_07815 [Candidatus Sericytochromatia bacterium]
MHERWWQLEKKLQQKKMTENKKSNKFRIILITTAILGFVVGFLIKEIFLDILLGGSIL